MLKVWGLVVQVEARGVGTARRFAIPTSTDRLNACPERESFIDNLLFLIHFIIVMIRRTGLAPWQLEFPLPGSVTSTAVGSLG